MSDEELNIEDVGGAPEDVESPVGGKKTGFLPGMVITILKWAAIGLGFVILGVTTTLITSNIINKGRTPVAAVQMPEALREVGDPLETYNGIGTLRGTTSDESPAIWSGAVMLAYPIGDKQLQEQLIQRKDQLSYEIMKLLSGKKFSELTSKNYDNLTEEIKRKVNDNLKGAKIEAVYLGEFTVIP